MLAPDLVRWSSAILVVVFVVGAIVAARKSYPAGRAAPVRAGRPLTFVTGPLWDVVAFAPILALIVEVILPDSLYGGPWTVAFPGDVIAQLAGLGLFLASGALFVSSIRELGRHTRPDIVVIADHRLVVTGPYAVVRHPIYLAILLMGAGTSLFLLNAILAFLCVVTYAIADRRATAEEDLLASEDAFGRDYRTYVDRTGRIFPRLRRRT